MSHMRLSERRTNIQEGKRSFEKRFSDMKDFPFINLHGLHLRTIDSNQFCNSLKICILSKNFLTDISPLRGCINLIKLDLHSNQIRFLPDVKFWSEMKQLKLLYLHDNSFVKLKNVCSLSGCPNLIGLTLHDCPVSLKNGYRHVIVNSIWSLKILDYFVISDEEIIQNWSLPERFRTFNEELFCDITPVVTKDTSYEKELVKMNFIIAKINRIVSHTSPVVILQKWIRGHLSRRMRKKPYPIRMQWRPVIIPETITIRLSREGKDKRPMKEDVKEDKEIEQERFILPKRQVRIVAKEMIPKQPAIFSFNHRALLSCALSELRKKESQQKPPKLKPSKVSKVSEEKAVFPEMDLTFRMPIIKVRMCLPPTRKYSEKLKKIGQEIHHRPVYRICHFFDDQSKYKIIHHLEKREKKEAAKTHETVDFAPFLSIDRQYKNREKAQEFQNKVQLVAMVQIANEVTKDNLQDAIQEKKYIIRKSHKEQCEKIEESLQKFQENKAKLLEKMNERRLCFQEEAKSKAEERMMVEDLSTQHTTLTKELFQFDRYKRKEDITKARKSIVKELKNTDRYRRDLVKKMKEGRIRAIHKRHREEKLIIHTIAAQKASDRIQEAKDKVAAMKSQRVNINIPFGQPKQPFFF